MNEQTKIAYFYFLSEFSLYHTSLKFKLKTYGFQKLFIRP